MIDPSIPPAAAGRGRKFFIKPARPADAARAARTGNASLKRYADGAVTILPIGSPAELEAHLTAGGLFWLNIDGSNVEAKLIAALGRIFSFHQLAIEDVKNRKQRAKLDRFDDGTCIPHLLIVARIPDPSSPGATEQLSVFIRDNLVVTIQASPGGDCLDPARARACLLAERGVLTAGLLAAEVLDTAVMDYMLHLPGPEDKIDELNGKIGSDATDDLIKDFHEFRSEALHLLRDLRPLQDVLNQLAFNDYPFVSPPARAKFKDALDHQQRAVDTLNHLAEESKELMNLTLAMASHKMNEVMQVLTIVSALLIPPTLVAGVYGMNFDREASFWNMPELGWQHGYLFALGLMLVLAGIQIWLFVRNGWWVNPLRFKKRATVSTLLSRRKRR